MCAGTNINNTCKPVTGCWNQVSEYTFFEVDVDDIQDPDNTSLHYNGTWVRVNPWLPWMLMGQADEARPVVIVRGLEFQREPSSADHLLRSPAEDLFS